MTGPSLFKRDPGHRAAPASPGAGQRLAFIALAVGALVPVLFLGVVRPVAWVAAFQLACLAGLAYLRWRSPRLRGSLLTVLAAVLACAVSVLAGFMA